MNENGIGTIVVTGLVHQVRTTGLRDYGAGRAEPSALPVAALQTVSLPVHPRESGSGSSVPRCLRERGIHRTRQSTEGGSAASVTLVVRRCYSLHRFQWYVNSTWTALKGRRMVARGKVPRLPRDRRPGLPVHNGCAPWRGAGGPGVARGPTLHSGARFATYGFSSGPSGRIALGRE
jgi:hypothetical protein